MQISAMESEYFKFIHERQLIWYKRFVLKQDPPWTDDKILKTYKFINMYRELDKCTIYIINKLKNIKDRKTLLLNIIFYRFFNKFNLYEDLGVEPFSEVNKAQLAERFERIKRKGLPIFNNAYLISSGGTDKKHINILNNLEKLQLDKLIEMIDKSKTPEESLEVLQKIPMVGPFLACEIWTDLTYFKFFKQNWSDDDFVNIGPGAKWGLEIIYNKLNKKQLNERLYHLHELQKQILTEWKKIAYKQAYSNYPFLSITNIEGALCEFRKYWNIKHGKGRRRYFRESVNYLRPDSVI